MTRLIIVAFGVALGLSVPLRASAACLIDADCSDGSVCTGVEHCVGGSCIPGNPLDCGDNNLCTLDACDAIAGCQHGPVLNGTGCSDGLFCNGAETCQGGICTAGQAAPNGASCDDGNRCTDADSCQGGQCVAGSTRPDASQCSDGNACNGLERCFGGVCSPGQSSANGTPCGDGNPCNGDEVCQNSVCTSGTPKPNGALCTDAFVCNGTETCQNQLCIAGTPQPNGTSCSDGNACNGAETCQNQICVSGAAPQCDDGNPCTQDSCNQQLGCQNPQRPNGASCADLDDCNGQETCMNGSCTPGIPEANGIPCSDGLVCNGLEVCQQAHCTPGTPLQNGTSCNDSNVCNGTDSCQNGQCVSVNPPNCNDGNPCTVDTCNPGLGCLNTVRPNGSSCEDGDVCNGNSACQGGQCVTGAPLNCDDANLQTIDGCDPIQGCTIDHTFAGALFNLRKSGPGRWAVKAKTADDFTFAPGALGNGTAADPVLHGASIRLATTNPASPFDGRYELPASGWSYIGKAGDNAGYRFRDRSKNASIRTAKIKSAKPWKFTGKGGEIGPKLDVDPNPVAVHVTLGNQRYCLSFGGDTAFELNHKYRAEDAPAPASCAP